MTKQDDDMERLGRIDRLLGAAIDEESKPIAGGGRRHLKSADAISRALATIRHERDLDDLRNLLVIDALYGRLEMMMQARGAVPDDDRVHIPGKWRLPLQWEGVRDG